MSLRTVSLGPLMHGCTLRILSSARSACRCEGTRTFRTIVYPGAVMSVPPVTKPTGRGLLPSGIGETEVQMADRAVCPLRARTTGVSLVIRSSGRALPTLLADSRSMCIVSRSQACCLPDVKNQLSHVVTSPATVPGGSAVYG